MLHEPIIVVGGGFSGLVAAYELALKGKQVTLLESDSTLGGLAGVFEVSPGIQVEKFYHHWFTSDADVLDLAARLGLASELRFMSSRTGLYHANSCFRLASPLDLLRFPAIPLVDRIRTGLMALRARRIKNWQALESQSAEEWLIRHGGRRAYDVMWQPLLRGKFGTEARNVSAVWLWNKLKLRGGSRDRKGAEQLVYMRGGFGRLISALETDLKRLGVEIYVGRGVERIRVEGERVIGVCAGGAELQAGTVLCTVPLPVFLDMVPDLPVDYREHFGRMRFLGNVCLVMRLKRSLSETYWLNVADPTFPFVGVIEHTNFDSPGNYGGEHIVYLSKYLQTAEPLFQYSDRQFFEYALPYLKRIFPEFCSEWVLGYRAWRAQHSQPVVVKNYSALVPQFATPISGLWLCTMAQVYPEDRGTNYAVRYAKQVVREMCS